MEAYSIADAGNPVSRALAAALAERLSATVEGPAGLSGQAAGARFEKASSTFLEAAMASLAHLRPANWTYHRSTQETVISRFVQYEHLDEIQALIENNKELHAVLGGDYLVTPDIVVAREPLADGQINAVANGTVVDDDGLASFTGLRSANSTRAILHASISCKWTIRSDRAQNTRTESNNLLKNRKGRLPHIVAVTMEPQPARLASICMGTGELDCTYHAALPELLGGAEELAAHDDQFVEPLATLRLLIDSGRLRDISDLPLDLVF